MTKITIITMISISSLFRIVFCVGFPSLMWIAIPGIGYAIEYHQFKYLLKHFNNVNSGCIKIIKDNLQQESRNKRIALYLLASAPLYAFMGKAMWYVTS